MSGKRTVTVPLDWLERLIELGERADVKVYPRPAGFDVDKTRLDQLKGFIESAAHLLDTDEEIIKKEVICEQ